MTLQLGKEPSSGGARVLWHCLEKLLNHGMIIAMIGFNGFGYINSWDIPGISWGYNSMGIHENVMGMNEFLNMFISLHRVVFA